MRYRNFGPLNWKVSALGFGAMRLPIVGGDPARIDEDEAIKMIRYAIDNGLNYVDTAYPYHRGNSEIVVGKALQDGYRERVKLATKMPSWLVEEYKDFDKFLDEQLEKLQTDHIDFYLLHGLKDPLWPKLVELDVYKWAEKKMNEGKIRYLGFSFHDKLPVFKKIIDSYDGWTFCQIQYNYMDTDYQAGTEGLKYAAEKGLAVVIMEPLKGGKLSVTPPKKVQDIWSEAKKKLTPAEWALQWVWNHPEVSTVLSGMSTMDHVKENLLSAERSSPNSLEGDELNRYGRVKEAYNELGFIGCTACEYCMPCPQGIEIPMILGFYNEYYMSGQSDEVKEKYWEKITTDSHADHCISCATCEELCPQQLPIRKFMSESSRIFKRQEN
jgi:predicted aldo/keto reductase-like oxidoreductase